jgi:hypothetical protein
MGHEEEPRNKCFDEIIAGLGNTLLLEGKELFLNYPSIF